MSSTLVALGHTLGHFHPALVHFPVALLLSGAALEAWQAMRSPLERSMVARVLLALGAAGSLLAVASGLLLYHPEDFRDRVLAAVQVHRVLGFCTAGAALGAFAASRANGARPASRARLWVYRLALFLAAALAGLAGHYGGWVVTGWGKIWTW